MFSLYEDYNDCVAPKTLCDWVKNFRIKKMQMKRKLRASGNLRVCAIMATALHSAENQLRLKQQERFNRCLQLQPKFHVKLSGTASPTPSSTVPITAAIEYEDDHKRRIEICNLWKDELNGLDEFMRKMSSSGGGGSGGIGNCSNVESRACSANPFHQYGDSNEANTARHSIAVST